jgi:hypothetical protein
MIVAMIIVWGGLVASAVLLARRPEVSAWPTPGPDDEEDMSFN